MTMDGTEGRAMTSETPGIPGPNELLEAWRKSAADVEQRWNDYFNQLMGTEAFGQMMARSMDSFLTLQSTMSRGMEQYLRALNLPSRSDLVTLAERIAIIEQKVDAIATFLEDRTLISEQTAQNGARSAVKSKRSGSGKRRQERDGQA